jgi:hypothetical protein
MYMNLYLQGHSDFNVDLSEFNGYNRYWSSTEPLGDYDNAYAHLFWTGYALPYLKNGTNYVRAVRAF